MKSDRRSFLKFAAAAPAAAPIIAKSAAESFGVASLANASPALNQVGTSLMGGVSGAPKDWLREEAKNLLKARKKMLRGENGNYPRDTRIRPCAEVDALRSLSSAARIRIAEERILQAERDRQLSYLDERLKEVKEQLGLDIFGAIFNELESL